MHPPTARPVKDGPTATRRTLLGAGAAGALQSVTGCTINLGDPETAPSGTGSPSATGDTASPSASASPSDTEFDLELVSKARAEIAAMTVFCEKVAAAHAKLRKTVGPLRAVHRAHDRLLADAGAVPKPKRRPQVPPKPRDALAAVRRREAALQGHLAGLSGEARSGPLARLFASMSAALAQQLAVLPERA